MKKKRRRVGQLVHFARLDGRTTKCGSRGTLMVSVAQGDWSAVTCPKCRASLVAGAVVTRRFGGL